MLTLQTHHSTHYLGGISLSKKSSFSQCMDGWLDARHTTLADKCWVVEDILASLACAKTKQKLSEIVFIVREPV